jgi:hypothetical protein
LPGWFRFLGGEDPVAVDDGFGEVEQFDPGVLGWLGSVSKACCSSIEWVAMRIPLARSPVARLRRVAKLGAGERVAAARLDPRRRNRG